MADFFSARKAKVTPKKSFFRLSSGPIEIVYGDKRKSDETYRTIFENTGTAMVIIEADETISIANAEFEKLSGYSKIEIEHNKKWTEFFNKEDLAIMKKYHKLRRIFPDAVPREYESRFIRRKEGIRHVHLTVAMIPGTKKSVASIIDITQRKKVEDDLRKSEKRFRDMANLLPQAIFEIDIKGKILFVNENAYSMFRYSKKDIEKGFDPFATLISKDKMHALMNIKKQIKNKKMQSAEYTALRKDGTTFPAIIHSKPVIKNEKVVGVRGILVDITERKESEELMNKLKMVVEQSMDGMAVSDVNGNIEFANSAWAKMHGYKKDQLTGKHLRIFHTKEQMKKDVIPFNKQVMKLGGNQGEIGHVKKNGTSFPTFMTTTLLRDDFGKPVGIVGIARDITKQKEAEKIVEQRAREFNVLYRVQSHTRIAYTLNVVLSSVAKDLIQAFRYNDNVCVEIAFDDKRYGTQKCAHLIGVIEEPIMANHIKRGVIRVGYMKTPIDVKRMSFLGQEKKVVESVAHILGKHAAAREVIERYRKVVRKSTTGIYIIEHGIISYANPRFCKMFKTKKKNVIGSSITEFILNCPFYDKIAKSEQFANLHSELRGKREDGEEIDVSVFYQQIDYNGKIAALGSVQDITKIKEAERKMQNFNEELRQLVNEKTKHLEVANRRLQSLNELKDEFIAVASHELRSPLTSIRGYLSFLVEKESLDSVPESVKHYLLRAYSNAESLNHLVNNILDVSRLDTGRFELQTVKTDLIQLSKNIIDSLALQANEKSINITFKNPSYLEKLILEVDSIRISQVLRNLLDNAIKYSKSGKDVNVEVGTDWGFAVIKISDQGVGIPKTKVKHIFDKFTQLKNANTRYKGGAGLGLFIAKRIIQLHNGIIRVESEKNKGTTFIIQLPLESNQ